MEDPRKKPLRENMGMMEAADRFLREVVYGFDREEFGETYIINSTDEVRSRNWLPAGRNGNQKFSDFFSERWKGKLPTLNYFLSNGYLIPSTGDSYILTPQAFGLLSVPEVDPSVFISYRRQESSAFALLIEARVKDRGGNAYLDKNLKGGDNWHGQLEERVKASKYLVCLIGPSTLESEFVRKEIIWAREAKVTIIPVCHNGQTLGDASEQFKQLMSLEMPHGDAIKSDPLETTAAEYETLVNFVLNALGYSTY